MKSSSFNSRTCKAHQFVQRLFYSALDMVSIAASMRRQLCPPFHLLCASVFPPTTSCFCPKLFARLHLERRRHRTQIENHPCNPSRPSQIAYTATWHADGSGDRKYINNQHPTSCVPLSAPSEAHNIAAFLVSFQHVQWEKTKKELFVSDYQGACGLLTDPQITYVIHL